MGYQPEEQSMVSKDERCVYTNALTPAKKYTLIVG